VHLNKDIQTLKKRAIESGVNELQAEFSTAEQLEDYLILDFLKKEYKKSISRRIKMGIAAKRIKDRKKESKVRNV